MWSPPKPASPTASACVGRSCAPSASRPRPSAAMPAGMMCSRITMAAARACRTEKPRTWHRAYETNSRPRPGCLGDATDDLPGSAARPIGSERGPGLALGELHIGQVRAQPQAEAGADRDQDHAALAEHVQPEAA